MTTGCETERALRAVAAKIGERYSHFINKRGLANTITAELLPLFNAGIVGAYAAAAKRASEVINGIIESGTDIVAELSEQILALTPADARQAPKSKWLRSSCWWCGKDTTDLEESCTHSESTPDVVEAATLLISMDACDHFCCGKPANICRATKLAAATASAEARARLAGMKYGHNNKHIACGCLVCAEITELTRAARMPDSTKDQA